MGRADLRLIKELVSKLPWESAFECIMVHEFSFSETFVETTKAGNFTMLEVKQVGIEEWLGWAGKEKYMDFGSKDWWHGRVEGPYREIWIAQRAGQLTIIWSWSREIDIFCAWFWLNIQIGGREAGEQPCRNRYGGLGSLSSMQSQIILNCLLHATLLSQKMSMWLKTLSKIMPCEHDASCSSPSTTFS